MFGARLIGGSPDSNRIMRLRTTDVKRIIDGPKARPNNAEQFSQGSQEEKLIEKFRCGCNVSVSKDVRDRCLDGRGIGKHLVLQRPGKARRKLPNVLVHNKPP